MTPSQSDGEAITPAGQQALEAELEELQTSGRRAMAARILAARELGDLKENADYSSAREEQSFLEGRIKTIEALLRDATLIEAPSSAEGGKIGLGSKVSIADPETPDDVTIYELVGPPEADPAAGRISNMSPVGKALVGKTAGQTVTVRTPRGDADFVIVAVD
jgi:transcription elongation factor GreA